jgi:hypothetical protein
MNSITTLLAWLEASQLANAIRTSGYLFAIIESFHVIGLTMVFGTIAIIDFRLLGFASARRPFRRIASDVLKWTWAAFALSVMTGSLLFISNAANYYHNNYFRLKMVLLALSGLNMLIFEVTTAKSVHRWENDPFAPVAGRAAAVVSLLLWTGIIFCGRWIGFTTL